MAYNKASEERKWRLWKEAEEKQLRELGVSEEKIAQLRAYDWEMFNSDRRYYEHHAEGGDYLELLAAAEEEPDAKNRFGFPKRHRQSRTVPTAFGNRPDHHSDCVEKITGKIFC